MMDLSTKYLGMTLKNPVMVSANPLCEDIENIRRMEQAGASAIVLHSLFEEQIAIESHRLDRNLSFAGESYSESLSYFPDMRDYNLGPEGYLRHIDKAKKAVDIPIIASLNGVTNGGWAQYARKIQEAGADALELNIYDIPGDPHISGAHLEQAYCELVTMVNTAVTIPLAVKLHPFFTAIPNMAKKLDLAGADGLVLFNRFYQPDLDIENLEIVPHLNLSSPQELLLRLHWTALLHGFLRADIAVTGGVHTGIDVLKAMMAGARVVMVASAILRHGISHITTMLNGLKQWMGDHEYESISQMQGSMSRTGAGEASAFHRANYMKVLGTYTQDLKGRPGPM